jgi:hypothetical protein
LEHDLHVADRDRVIELDHQDPEHGKRGHDHAGDEAEALRELGPAGLEPAQR